MPLKPWNSGPALTPFPRELADRERDMIVARRKAAKVNAADPLVGLAISGGGIRSATFGLGVLQALAKADVLKKVDYLSTVSGGGYIGSFLGRLYTRGENNDIDALKPGGGTTTTEKVRALLLDRESKPNKWLRENGRYLTPNGAGDVIAGFAVAVRNFFSVHLVMALLTLPMALVVVGLASVKCPCLHVSLLWLIAGCFAAAAAVTAAAYWRVMLTGVHFREKWPAPRCRRMLTSFMGYLLLFMAAFVLLALLEWSAAKLYVSLFSHRHGYVSRISFAAVTAFIFGSGLKIVKTIRDLSGPAVGLGFQVVGSIAGIALFVFYAFLCLLAAVAVAHCGGWAALLVSVVCVGILAALMRCCKQTAFVSDSTFAPLYEARLERAYLGASNKKHFDPNNPAVTEPLPDDDTEMGCYLPHEQGGPLHLINLTLNETITQSNTEHRDRKGMGLSCGPAGVSVGARHHALYQNDQVLGRELKGIHSDGVEGHYVFPKDPFQYENMKLGRWAALSGAFVSTGMGAHNSLGMSLLFGISNMRLGHWWNSGVKHPTLHEVWKSPSARKSLSAWKKLGLGEILPLHAFLLNEWFGRFYGTASRYWYLTDGGHYENTAAYELIRRRLPYIIVCDDGCDPKYAYADLGNLVRKARIDFGAAIEILSTANERRKFLAEHRQALHRKKKNPAALLSDDFGRQKDINRGTPPTKDADDIHPAHALLARIAYEDGTKSLMIVLKPSLTGDEHLDVRQYAKEHAKFPNESTGDQVFDEAQWESYRELGFHVANKIFGDKGLILT